MSKRHYKAVDIAYWFLNRCKKDGIEPNLTYIMFMCYYAQGAFLAIDDRPLFRDTIQAWEHGPAVPAVYEHFKDQIDLFEGYRHIPLEVDDYRFNPDGSIEVKEDSGYRQATKDETEVLSFIFSDYIGGKRIEDNI